VFLLRTRSRSAGIRLADLVSDFQQVPFIHTRSIYEIRERPSRMYSWSALVTAQILVELPWNILGSSLWVVFSHVRWTLTLIAFLHRVFFCWYWTVGFPSSRAGFTFLLYGILFPMYYTTIAQVRGRPALS
jgi:ATP-binding cassette subfamily G (WHITE) protein 2 (SNQ2)